jgi:hypothetical protein
MDENKIIIYQTEDGQTQIDVRLENETVWLTQADGGIVPNHETKLSLHVGNVFKEGKLEQEATVKEYLTVQNEGNRKVTRKAVKRGPVPVPSDKKNKSAVNTRDSLFLVLNVPYRKLLYFSVTISQ